MTESEILQKISDLSLQLQAETRGLRESIKDVQSKIPIQCKLGHWNPKDEVCPYCAKLETDIAQDNGGTDGIPGNEEEESVEQVNEVILSCENGLCDCDKGECDARSE